MRLRGTLRPIVAGAGFALLVAACARTPPPRAPQAPPATPNESATPGPPVVSLQHWADFEHPLSIRAADDGKAWYIAERFGKVWRYDGTDRRMIIDVTEHVSAEAEQGLFDFVISPDGRRAYIHFSGKEKPFGDNHVWGYRWTGSGVRGEPEDVLTVEHPYIHHYGGQMQFGPDGYLYIAIGDGGVPELAQEADNGDPHNNGQGTDELLGNVLRIDPSKPRGSRLYSVPDDNPLVGKPGRDEIWAYGLRNPWRFSFDRRTGDLWLPDVGHRFQEEINFQPARSEGGQNYGWSLREGPLEYKGEPPRNHTEPIYAYPHRGGPCAIVGGYTYRGTKIDALVGWFVFGDFCTGAIQAIKLEDGRVVAQRNLGVSVPQLVSFAEDHDGELFALAYEKGIFRIAPVGTG